MKKLVCEQCGSIDLVREDDYYVCQYCGCKYIPDKTGDALVPIKEQSEADQTGSRPAVPKMDPAYKRSSVSSKAAPTAKGSAGIPKTVSVSFAIAAVVGVIMLIAYAGNNNSYSGLKEESTVTQEAVDSEKTEEIAGKDTVSETQAGAKIQEDPDDVQLDEKKSLPYVGMPEKDIDHTALGLSYYNGASHDTVNGKRTTVDIYFYIQSDYGIIYTARVANGKVISVKDYRDDPWYFPAFMEGLKKNGRKTKASY